ncbi:hypothetical protein HYPSUDRAFT_82409 [Hypholoma sublateritium FD-334 SS-4]|uniref:MARVEL domain-containing protein n=1 Tax=Hypholoma sublateritium (strain FD-334 SS-4) TaxID=945553 RepID=A0A0D2PDB3_HYPSF|nr:hypothetical protein HYPSUDRAFT_82409 [Hypholoma sublateritium FD-334 SS-4]
MAERFTLPISLLLISIICSATYLGLTMHDVAQRPIFNISLTVFTIFFHSILLLSIPTTPRESHQEPKFYISPLEQPFSAWGILIALFWVVTFLSDANKIWAWGGQRPTVQDYCFATLSSLECLINMDITWRCVVAARAKPNESFQLANRAQGRNG